MWVLVRVHRSVNTEEVVRNLGLQAIYGCVFSQAFLGERKAHPPLGARAEVYHGVKVVVTGNHRNRTAPSGWMVRLVLHLLLGDFRKRFLNR